MDRADAATMTNSMREAFLASGRDVAERKTVTGNAFLVSGRAIGQFEERAGLLRVRLWLGDKERAAFEGRPTFDRDSGWLHVISDDDVRFVCGLAPVAYRAAVSGKGAPPSARAVEMPSNEMPARVPPGGSEEKKKGAATRRPPSGPARRA
jgi:hypothetical protein